MIGNIPVFRVSRFNAGVRIITRSYFKSRNPPEPHYDRKRMLEVCKPIYLPERVPEHLTCQKNLPILEEPHPYEVILSKELKEKVDESKMILIYHVNSLTEREQKSVYRSFYKQDLSFHIYSMNTLRLALEDTKYQAILRLFESSGGLVFGPEVSLSKVFKVNREVQEKLILLAGVIEDEFYSKSQLIAINQLLKRNIHGEMVQTIQAPSQNICRSVNHQMNLLSHYLTEISKDEK